jgi:hypothetical protein
MPLRPSSRSGSYCRHCLHRVPEVSLRTVLPPCRHWNSNASCGPNNQTEDESDFCSTAVLTLCTTHDFTCTWNWQSVDNAAPLADLIRNWPVVVVVVVSSSSSTCSNTLLATFDERTLYRDGMLFALTTYSVECTCPKVTRNSRNQQNNCNYVTIIYSKWRPSGYPSRVNTLYHLLWH